MSAKKDRFLTLRDVLIYECTHKSDISDHLESIFTKVVDFNPELIVELGVGTGQSTYVFSKVNETIGSRLISVDNNRVPYNNITNGTLVVNDDVSYATVFNSEYGNTIDVLFIDTSQLYDHTAQELVVWLPLLKEKALVIFHDTNLKETVFRKDGTIAHYWDNERGVTRAIEEYFGIQINEETTFESTFQKDGVTWKIDHVPYCNGLMFLYKN
jgi:predicted O-methyltransferase YrrM